MQRRHLLAAGGLTAAVAAVAAAAGILGWDRNGDTAPLTMQEYPPGARPPAPASIAGETLDGGHLDIADLRGEVVVVNIWGSWCGPCRAEMADLEEVHQATRDLGVRFVGINIRDDRDKAIRFAESRVSYPSIYDPGSAYALGFRDPPAPVGPPATLVIDRAGGVAVTIYRVVGRVELEQVVTRVAAEPR